MDKLLEMMGRSHDTPDLTRAATSAAVTRSTMGRPNRQQKLKEGQHVCRRGMTVKLTCSGRNMGSHYTLNWKKTIMPARRQRGNTMALHTHPDDTHRGALQLGWRIKNSWAAPGSPLNSLSPASPLPTPFSQSSIMFS